MQSFTFKLIIDHCIFDKCHNKVVETAIYHKDLLLCLLEALHNH